MCAGHCGLRAQSSALLNCCIEKTLTRVMAITDPAARLNELYAVKGRLQNPIFLAVVEQQFDDVRSCALSFEEGVERIDKLINELEQKQ